MAQTLVSLLVHVIFSTKNREPFISPSIEPELFANMGGILKNQNSRLLDAGGTADHCASADIAIEECLAEFLDERPKEGQFLVDQNEGSRVRQFSLAGWVWSILYRPFTDCRVEEIYQPTEGASSEANLSGRTYGVLR